MSVGISYSQCLSIHTPLELLCAPFRGAVPFHRALYPMFVIPCVSSSHCRLLQCLPIKFPARPVLSYNIILLYITSHTARPKQLFKQEYIHPSRKPNIRTCCPCQTYI